MRERCVYREKDVAKENDVSKENDVAKENDDSKRQMCPSCCWTVPMCSQFRLWCCFSEENDSVKEKVPSKTGQNH